MRRFGIDLRLAIPAIGAWAACGLLVVFPGLAPAGAVVLWGVAVATTCAAFALPSWRARLGILVVALAAAALCATSAAANAGSRRPEPLLTAAAKAESVTAVIRVDSTPVLKKAAGSIRTSWRFHGTMTSASVDDGISVSADSPVYVFLPEDADADAFEIGSTVAVIGGLQADEAWSQSAFLVFGDRASPAGPAPPYLDWANALRSDFLAATGRLPGDGGKLLPGLAIGDVSRVPPLLDDAMKQSSLSHLTAVSGANCAVIVAAVMFLAGAVGLGRKWRVIAALTVLAGFVVLVTPTESVLRAAVMAAIVAFSSLAGRGRAGVPALSATVVVLLAVDPWLATNYGFALSVLATAGLLVLAAPIARLLARWLPRWLAAGVAIPLAAQVACQPVLVLLSPTIPLYGVGSNLLAEPAAPLATVLGLIACVLLPVVPALGMVCAHVAWAPSAWIAAVATVAARLPFSSLPWLGGLAGTLAVAAVVAGVIVLVREPRGRHRTWLTAASGAVLVLGFGGYAGAVAGSRIARAVSMPADWQIGACDVGQGDALVVRSGERHALIDTGPDPAALTSCLRTLGIDRIDLLVLTHYDLDHVGGVDAVVGNATTALVGPIDSEHDRRILNRLRAAGTRVRQTRRGDHGTLGALSWRVLWPEAPPVTPPGNESSVTLVFSGDGIRSVFLGDLDERAQDALLSAGKIGPVDVVKVAHHGSADQSERLYELLDAAVGVISVGEDNDYGHPTPRLLGILAGIGTAAVRTDQDGMILIGGAGHRALSVWTETDTGAGAGTRAGPRAESAAGSAVAGRLGEILLGLGKGVVWRHANRPGPRRGRSHNSVSARLARLPSFSSAGGRSSSRRGRSERYATRSPPRTRASRSPTSTPRSTYRANC